jgi:hypothetical protein
MINNKNGKFLVIIAVLTVFFIPTTPPVIGQEIKSNKMPAQGEATPDWKTWDYKLGEWTEKNRKKIVIAGIPMGTKRSEIMSLLTGKNIAPLQRTVPMDIFPRLIREISYLKKAYLFYTKDQLSKLTLLFNVPYEKTSTGEPLFEFYKELLKKLTQHYGQPTNNTAYVHPNFAYTLVALETGNAYFFDYWENVEDMKILLSLKGRDGEINFSLTYQYLPLFEEN